MDKIEHKLVLILDQETPRSAIDRLHTLKADGYRVEDIPADGDALMRALLTSDAEEMFQRGDYGVYFATLPRACKTASTSAGPRRSAIRPSTRAGWIAAPSPYGRFVAAMLPSRSSRRAATATSRRHTGISPFMPGSSTAFARMGLSISRIKGVRMRRSARCPSSLRKNAVRRARGAATPQNTRRRRDTAAAHCQYRQS